MRDHVSALERARQREGTVITVPSIADPMVLGLYAFAGAVFLVATRVLGWYTIAGDSRLLLIPFVAVLGGMAQLLAAIWAYRARDTLGTTMLGTWSSFFIGYAILSVLLPAGRTTGSASFPELGYWYIVTAAISWMGMFAVLGRNRTLAGWLGTAAAGSTLAAIGLTGGYAFLNVIGAWLFVVSSVIAWYGATALMFRAVRGRGLPMGEMIEHDEPVLVETEPLRRVG